MKKPAAMNSGLFSFSPLPLGEGRVRAAVSPAAMSEKLIAALAPRASYFSLLVQRKVTKRKHTPDVALFLRSAALGPSHADEASCLGAAPRTSLCATLRASSQSLAVLARDIRDPKTSSAIRRVHCALRGLITLLEQGRSCHSLAPHEDAIEN